VRLSAWETLAAGKLSSAQPVGEAAQAESSAAVLVSVPAPDSAASLRAPDQESRAADLNVSACPSSKPEGPSSVPPSETERKLAQAERRVPCLIACLWRRPPLEP